MSLINLRTNLKDLKFGNDRAGNGNSNEPYVVAKIPATNEPLQTGFLAPNNNGGLGLRIPNAGTGGPDFLLRGGYLILDKIIDDEKRLFKFFTSTKGILFTVKQNLLSRIAVNTQASPKLLNEGVYTPISSLVEAAGVPFGLHVNKQGLNPFGGVLGKTTYSDVVNTKIKPEKSNRLVLLSEAKIYNLPSDSILATQISPSETEILKYGGGPDSFLGIGKTHIYFADQRTGVNNPLRKSDSSFFSGYNSIRIQKEYLNRQGEFVKFPNDYNNNLLRLIRASNDHFQRESISDEKLGDPSLQNAISFEFTYGQGKSGKDSPLIITNPSFFYGTNTKTLNEYLNQKGESESIPNIFSENLLRFVRASTQYKLTSKDITNNSLSNVVSPVYKPTPSTGKNNPLLKTNPTFFITGSVPVRDQYLTREGNLKPIPDNSNSNLQRFLGASNKYGINEDQNQVDPGIISENNPIQTVKGSTEDNSVTYTSDDIKSIDIYSSDSSGDQSSYIGKSILGGNSTPGDFRSLLRSKYVKADPTAPYPKGLSLAPNYRIKNLQSDEYIKLGDPGSLNKDTSDYNNASSSPTSYDKLNASTLYRNSEVQQWPDLVPFRIEVLNNDSPSLKTFIHFRAFLDSISDQYISNWDPTKYIGRGENFYTYSGFDRKVSLSWTVAAQSKAELIPMYKRLNYLASVCAPDYNSNGYMRGNIVKLTVGGYFHEQYGIITGLSYEMNENTDPWEIGIDTNADQDNQIKALPHVIRVKSFSFIPIHTFVPRTQQLGFDSESDEVLYGPERYIALRSDTHPESNYGPIYTNPTSTDQSDGEPAPTPSPTPVPVQSSYQTTPTQTIPATRY